MSFDLFLHKAVFMGDSELLENLLKTADEKQINCQDIHGNTALHIAVMKGNKRCVELLIKSGAITTIRNELNWMSHHEAISYGDIEIIKLLNAALSLKIHQMLKKEFLLKLFSNIKEDFIMKFELRIKDFNPQRTSGPPEALITLTKKGLKLKLDVIVLDSYHSRPDSFHFILNFTENSESFLTITVGEDVPVYQNVTPEEWEQILTDLFNEDNFEETLAELMQKENSSIKFTKDTTCVERPRFRKLNTKKVGKYKTHFYESQGIDLQTKKRIEHLRAREESNRNSGRVESLPPPTTRSHVTWDQYINSPKGMFPYLGRQTIETIQSNRVTIVVGLTDQIPVDWHWILDVFSKLLSDRFIEYVFQFTNELPKGFPVVIDFPIKPSAYFKYRCHSFEITSHIDDSLFIIPESYQRRVIFEIQRNQ